MRATVIEIMEEFFKDKFTEQAFEDEKGLANKLINRLEEQGYEIKDVYNE